jgi:hypothetical protein
VVVVTPEDSPIKRTQDIRDSPLRSALDGHCWYPAVQRCGCGLSLRSALLWTDHIGQISSGQPSGSGLVRLAE